MRPIDETGHTQDDDTAFPRYSQRLSDQLTGSFYEACRIGSLDTAKHLLLALECEVVRAAGTVAGADLREDGDDISAVRARLALELKRRQLTRRVWWPAVKPAAARSKRHRPPPHRRHRHPWRYSLAPSLRHPLVPSLA